MSRENLVLGEGVVLPDDVEVGANVVIHDGTVIGAFSGRAPGRWPRGAVAMLQCDQDRSDRR